MNQENILSNISYSNSQNDINNEDCFFPKEILLEEQRLKEEHTEEDEKTVINDLNEKQRKERFQNLLTLLENSTKLTNVFETRLKKCKLQIIKKEQEKANKMKGKIPSKTMNSLKIENGNEEDNYLSLFQQPKLFKGHLKNHQIEGLLWIRTLFENGLNGILADEMGLGKTIQTIAFYCFLIEMGIGGPFLVVAPLSTVPNWLLEFSKFSPEIPTLLYHGPEKERFKLRSKFKETSKVKNFNCYPVIITTYEVLRFDINFLKSIKWMYITIDEGQKLKNINAIISNCMRKLDCSNKLLLTGTPIQNDMSELWSLLNLLMPKIFSKLEDFNSWFLVEDFFGSNDEIANLAKKDEILNIILKILKPFILRREKIETDLNLPPKKEVLIYAPLTEVQQHLYKATLNKQLDILLKKEEESDIIQGKPKRRCVECIEKYTDLFAIKSVQKPEVETEKTAITLAMTEPMIQLKKIANHPYLVHMPLIPGTNNILVDENIVKVSGKFQVLDAMLTKLKTLGHKVLLFSTMVQILDVIHEFLILRNYKFTRLDGTMNILPRVNAINTFNNDPDYFLMIISTRAGGLGLNLTAADTVIIFDSDWVRIIFF
uniref:Lymphoid-specific helicase n=1 Tax=Sipha flava TaxID=143950 RepID=A0A2S2PYX8_9HEMI